MTSMTINCQLYALYLIWTKPFSSEKENLQGVNTRIIYSVFQWFNMILWSLIHGFTSCLTHNKE